MSRSNMPPIFRVFKGGDPKAFSYQPRYFDPEKERRRQVEEEAKQAKESGLIDEEGLRDRMRASWRAREAKTETVRSNIRLLIILVTLCTLVYILFLYLDQFKA